MVKKTKKRSAIRGKNKSSKGRKNPFWGHLIKYRIIPLTIGAVIMIMVVWFFQSGTYTTLKQKTYDGFITASVNHGFVINDVQVVGRNRVQRDTILALLNVQAGAPIFTFNPTQSQIDMEQLTWVKHARIERRLPDTLVVTIQERQPAALWQYNNKLSLIDIDGVVLTTKDLGRFNTLPMIIGINANDHAANILALVQSEPDIASRVDAITYISGRRWDITTQNGILIKLPEKDVGLALSRLAHLNRRDDILDRDLAIVDLRSGDRAILRPSDKANLTIERPLLDDDGSLDKKNI